MIGTVHLSTDCTLQSSPSSHLQAPAYVQVSAAFEPARLRAMRPLFVDLQNRLTYFPRNELDTSIIYWG